MSQTNLHFEDFSKICRLCLAYRELQPIRTTKILDLITSVTNLVVTRDDQLPEKICKKCVRHLEDITLFINICRSNVETLKSVIAKECVKPDNCPSEESDSGIITEDKIKVEIPENIDCPIIGECSNIKEIDEIEIAGIKSENDEQFLCDICNRKFSCKNEFDRHMFGHSKPKRHICEDCGKGFYTRDSLKRHFVTHTGVKAFKCEICKKCFAQSSNLAQHYKRHKGEKPHKCNSCAKAFLSIYHLNRHKMTHVLKLPIIRPN